jgi:hypothetical protein
VALSDPFLLHFPLHQLVLSTRFYPLAPFFQWTLFFPSAQKVLFFPSAQKVQ